MTPRFARQGLSLIALLILAALSACAPSAASATTTPTMPPPTATASIPGTPAGWSAYRGDHFTIAYPSGWTYTASAGGAGQLTVSLNGPQPRDQIIITETTGVPQDQVAGECAIVGATQVRLAGLTMSYQVVEGVHRVWNFFTSADTSYSISALDADQPTSTQAQHNAILATFRPDDTTSGCS